MACGQWIRPATAKVATEIAERAKEAAVFRPFIRWMSVMPQSAKSARSTMPSPPLK